jgi:hypothetical protein
VCVNLLVRAVWKGIAVRSCCRRGGRSGAGPPGVVTSKSRLSFAATGVLSVVGARLDAALILSHTDSARAMPSVLYMHFTGLCARALERSRAPNAYKSRRNAADLCIERRVSDRHAPHAHLHLSRSGPRFSLKLGVMRSFSIVLW